MFAGIALLIATVASSETCLSERPDIDRAKAVLKDAYTEFAVLQWPSEMRVLRKSQEHFDSDILFGDFNFDGVIGFAAKLIRVSTKEELSVLPEHSRERYQYVGLVVVCDGIADGGSVSEFRCTELTEEELGGVYGWLDLVDCPWCSGYSDEYGNSNCPAEMKANSGRKLLAIVEPLGQCDAFFYPMTDGGYGRCAYCAD